MSELLLGDHPPPPKGRPRWVDASGLVAVVAVILTIGILGSRDAGDGDAPPTTTTTVVPATAAPVTIGPTSTIATAPVVVGRIVPAPTATALLVLGTTTPRLLDVDSGTLRDVAGASGSDAVGLRGGFVLTDPNGLAYLPADGGPIRAFATSGRVVGTSGDRLWLTVESDDGGLLAREYDAGGRSTGRQLSLPRSATVEGGVEDGLVVSQAGSLTFVDAADGHGQDLGRGTIVALRGHTIARLSCIVLRCRLELVDVRTARAEAVDGLSQATDGTGAFSADGRWLAMTLTSGNERDFLVVIDVVNHRVGPAIEDGDASAFAARANLLFVAGSSRLRAYELPSGRRHDVAELVLPAVQRLVAAETG